MTDMFRGHGFHGDECNDPDCGDQHEEWEVLGVSGQITVTCPDGHCSNTIIYDRLTPIHDPCCANACFHHHFICRCGKEMVHQTKSCEHDNNPWGCESFCDDVGKCHSKLCKCFDPRKPDHPPCPHEAK